MILNDGKHVQGIFIYSPDIEYELGDFIVEGDCIYICRSGSPVKGKTPSLYPTEFSPYPGDMITSLDDYKKYVNDPDGKKDKYISSSVLSGILQDNYYGFGDSGVISAYIKLKDGNYSIDTQLLSILSKETSDISKPLDLLMKEPSVNNAYVQVSRDLIGVKNLLVDTGKDNCLLRQYTYLDLNDLGGDVEYRYRVQELVDFENGISYYRYTRGSKRVGKSSWNYGNTITDWTCTTKSKALLDKMNQILNHYANEKDMSDTVSDADGFNFRNLKLFDGTSNECILLEKNDSLSPYTKYYPCISPVSDFKTDPLILTVNLKIQTETSTNIFKSLSCTFNTQDTAIKADSTDYYYLEENILLKVEYKSMVETGNFAIGLSLVKKDQHTKVDGSILSIYYRNNGR